MVEPELTEVGELHSLTDWQVSEASEEAELDEFCSREDHTRGPTESRPHTAKIPAEIKRKIKDGGREGHAQRDRERRTDRHRRGKDERSTALGLFFPQSCKLLKRSVRPSKAQATRL